MSFSDWEEIRLGDLVKVKHGYAFKGKFFSETPTEDILVTPGNFKIGGGFKDEKLKYYKGEIPKDYILNPNDIIITMTDLSKMGDTLGYSALVPFSKNKRYLHNQRIGLIEFINEDVCPQFIYWRLRAKDYQQYIVGSASGTTVKHTSPNTIRQFTFRIPLIQEQKAIADTLSALEEKIELNNHINKNLEEMAQAIFKSWFVDFEPFQDGEFEDSDLGRIPKGWRVGTVSSYAAEMKNGSTPSRKNSQYWDPHDVPWIKTGEIRNSLIIEAEEFISYLGLNNSSAKLLPKNTILIAMYGATAGKIALLRFESTTNQACCGIICGEKSSASYLYLWMLRNQSTIEKLAVGSAQQNLSKEIISRLKIVIPANSILLDFEKIVSDIHDSIETNLLQIKQLRIIRDFLLPKLMSGKIRVPFEEVV
ncbi:MAG: restriction endonuclease subunit S [Syntrophomonas sp.]